MVAFCSGFGGWPSCLVRRGQLKHAAGQRSAGRNSMRAETDDGSTITAIGKRLLTVSHDHGPALMLVMCLYTVINRRSSRMNSGYPKWTRSSIWESEYA